MDYLSDAWIDAANHALSESESVAHADELVIAQQVEGARSYLVTVGAEGTSITDLNGAEPPAGAVCFRQNWATACSIARGETDAHQAFLLGEVHFSGEVATLVASAPVMAAIAQALEPVMACTTFPDSFRAA